MLRLETLVSRLQSSNLSSQLEIIPPSKYHVVPEVSVDEAQTKLQSERELAELTLKLGDALEKVCVR